MITYKYVNVGSCGHSYDCECPIEVQGVPGTPLASLGSTVLHGKKSEQVKKLTQIVLSRFKVVDGTIVPSLNDQFKDMICNSLNYSPNMKRVPAPVKKKAIPVDTPPYDPPPIVRDAYKVADFKVLPQYFRDPIDWEYLYSDLEDVGTYHNEVRKRSAYWSTYGKINGRPFRIAALDNVTGQKYIDAVMGYSRHTKELNAAGREAVKHVEEATRRMYNCMGYGPGDFGKERSVISFEEVMESAYLGSSTGVNEDFAEKKKTPLGEPVIITSTGKKIDMIHIDYQRIMDYLEHDKGFDTFFSMVGKVENYFSWTKQLSPEWEKWIRKMRLFNIPTSTFVLAEKLVSKLRMMKERGKMIMIGSKWSRGGADVLAKNLGIDCSNDFKRILVEGDLKNMDQTVHAFFVEYYMNMMLVHEDPDSLDYDLKVKLLQYIVPRMVERLTRLYSDVWVLHYGGVPSGCFNTSHMDSWIMGLYFFLFCTVQLAECPIEDKEELDCLISAICIVLYGDDHVYNKGDTRVSHYLSGFNFQTFLKQAFDVDLKDIFDGMSFLSSTDRGRIVKRGVCFLKQFFILNPHAAKYPNQPRYLPFRETNEFMIRAAYGRESLTRTEKEVALAMIGHAYGTYASNKIAYELLKESYTYILSQRQYDWSSDTELAAIYATKSMRRFRNQGVTMDELRKGFPSWEQLIKLNEVDEKYHRIRQTEFESHYSPDLPTEW